MKNLYKVVFSLKSNFVSPLDVQIKTYNIVADTLHLAVIYAEKIHEDDRYYLESAKIKTVNVRIAV